MHRLKFILKSNNNVSDPVAHYFQRTAERFPLDFLPSFEVLIIALEFYITKDDARINLHPPDITEWSKQNLLTVTSSFVESELIFVQS